MVTIITVSEKPVTIIYGYEGKSTEVKEVEEIIGNNKTIYLFNAPKNPLSHIVKTIDMIFTDFVHWVYEYKNVRDVIFDNPYIYFNCDTYECFGSKYNIDTLIDVSGILWKGDIK